MKRVVVWFSCGAASACAAKLAIERFGGHFPVKVVYCDTSINEHPDNKRFAQDVEKWLGTEIERISSKMYSSVDEVIAKNSYFAGVRGARCTTELKKKPRHEYQEPGDLHIWGYTVEEPERIIRFKENNPETKSYFILAGNGLTKDDCKNMLLNAGIALPVMYGLGFNNNNCIGCGKAESVEYWQHIRKYFPEIFAKRCQQSRDIGWRPLRLGRKRTRSYLDELPIEETGEPITEDISCGPHCGVEGLAGDAQGEGRK